MRGGGRRREAESTGLEPATSAVTGQRSNQLSYDSNPRNAKLEPIALAFNQKVSDMVGPKYQDLPAKPSFANGIFKRFYVLNR